MKVISKNGETTKKLAGELSKTILSSSSPRAFVILLSGDLGAGKTTFVQGFIKGAGVKRPVQSPTFVLLKKYTLPKKKLQQFHSIIHIDLYRLKKSAELKLLKIPDEVKDPKNIILIEWPEKIPAVAKYGNLKINFSHKKYNQRSISFIELT